MAQYIDPPGFAEWEATMPESIRRSPIWRTPAYRYGVWLADLVKKDAKVLRTDPGSRNNCDQLIRAVEAISSNLSEGYSCATGPERARYYSYALTSTREAIDWYLKAREVLGLEVFEQRYSVLDRIILILTVTIPRERGRGRRKRREPPQEE